MHTNDKYTTNLYILTKDYISKERKINKNLYFLCVSLSEECRRSDAGDRASAIRETTATHGGQCNDIETKGHPSMWNKFIKT